MNRVLCSTGAILTLRNNRDYNLLHQIIPQMKCDGLEFMMYQSWYEGHVEALKQTLAGFFVPVFHMTKRIGEWISLGGQSIYEGKPCGVTCEGAEKNFALKIGNKLYFYVHDLAITGDANVTVAGGGAGEKTFCGVDGKIKSVKWTDCDGNLDFTQDGDKVKINCTGYTYGKSLVVRVAEAELE